MSLKPVQKNIINQIIIKKDGIAMPPGVNSNTKHRGLTESQVKLSREKYGSNRLSAAKRTTFFKRFLSNLSDPIIKILIGALAVNVIFALGSFDIAETLGIVAAILISTLVSTFSEYGSEKAFEKLRDEGASEYFRVLRAGTVKEIHINDIVVGDIIYLSAGERVPADGSIVSGEVSLDQSAMTGESTEVKKRADGDKKIFRGSAVCVGQCAFVVNAVGDNTLYGGAATELASETRESPLKQRLSRLAKQISRIGYIAAIAVSVAYFFNDIFIDSAFDKSVILSKLGDFSYVYNSFMHCLTLAVTVVVVSVPEGLPMMITVVLSSNMKKMMRDNILVRKLVGIETAGSMNILFCDKTGTLTTGKQSVCAVVTGDGREFKNEKSLESQGFVYDILSLDASLNTGGVSSDGKLLGGNATDRALGNFFRKGEAKQYAVMGRVPFSSERKYSAVKVKRKNGCSEFCIVRGAPELILPRVKEVLTPSGKMNVGFDAGKINAKMREMTSHAFRVIAIALCDSLPDRGILAGKDLTLVALVGIRDALRREARAAVEQMHGALVQVVMLTGDNKETASAVARECSIIGKFSDSLVLTGEELSKMSDREVADALPRLAVIARALPGDKSRLVKIAQEMQLVVGMTGDGVNDAPALKTADIGFAMGSGTDVAKEAGDIVVLDNNFRSIVKAVLYGRTIFASIRKFITFQLTMNFCAVAVSLIGPFIGIDTPITVIQMLWINIIMDTLGALAFAGEAAVKDVMKEKPKKLSEGLLSRYMIGHIVFSGIVTVALCLAFLCSNKIRAFYGAFDDPTRHLGAFFGLFVFLGIFNCFTARTSRINLMAHLEKNRAFILIMTLIAAVQTLMIYFGGTTFRTIPLTFMELSFAVTLAFMIVPADLAWKVFLRMRRR